MIVKNRDTELSQETLRSNTSVREEVDCLFLKTISSHRYAIDA
jgi:hypothetical protein